MKTMMNSMKVAALAVAVMALAGCKTLDAAHLEGQKQDAAKYQQYSDVELQKQMAVAECFKKASTDNQLNTCALLGMATGMASTFGGRPTATTVAPTTAQAIGQTLEKIVPAGAAAWAAAKVAGSVSAVQAKDPLVVTQPAPVIVEPTFVEVPAPTVP